MPKAKKVTSSGKMVRERAKAISPVESGILRGLRQALAFERGERSVGRVTMRQATAAKAVAFDHERVQRVRKKLGLSQPLFAQVLNVSSASVRAWEQGRRIPDGPSVRLLEIAEQHPHVLLGTVQARTK